jgi:hypothetical protein
MLRDDFSTISQFFGLSNTIIYTYDSDLTRQVIDLTEKFNESGVLRTSCSGNMRRSRGGLKYSLCAKDLIFLT